MNVLVLSLVVLLPATVLAQTASKEMKRLAETERAFAAASVQHGIRASFLQYFADDGIAFQPGPVVYKEVSRDRPAPDPRAVTLEWEPMYGDVSPSGDLGYTTGPYRLTNNTADPAVHSFGYYFSVWKKQGDGSWKVALDIGIPTPSPGKEEAFTQASSRFFTPKPASTALFREQILEVERAFAEVAAGSGFASAVEAFFHTESRMHRPEFQPLVGKQRILSSLLDTVNYDFETLFAETAQAGNLAYTYGRYRVAGVLGGFYARVWKRDETGTWGVVADITSPAAQD